MSSLFIGNASNRRHEFTYRILPLNAARTVILPPMGAVCLKEDMSPAAIGAIVAQHEGYGFASAEDIEAGLPRKRQTYLCYSVGQPITPNILEALLRNDPPRPPLAAVDEMPEVPASPMPEAAIDEVPKVAIDEVPEAAASPMPDLKIDPAPQGRGSALRR